MKSATQKLPRGRPASCANGAQDAFDEIEQYKRNEGLKNNALATRFGMTPSTVNRVLQSREMVTWTPGFIDLYRNVQNALAGKAAIQRLADYTGPGEAIVRRILQDVDALVGTLSARKDRDSEST